MGFYTSRRRGNQLGEQRGAGGGLTSTWVAHPRIIVALKHKSRFGIIQESGAEKTHASGPSKDECKNVNRGSQLHLSKQILSHILGICPSLAAVHFTANLGQNINNEEISMIIRSGNPAETEIDLGLV